jgi:hypothetical protein
MAGSIPAVALDPSAVLVKAEIAKKQRADEAQKELEERQAQDARAYRGGDSPAGGVGEAGGVDTLQLPKVVVEPPKAIILRHFHASVDLDATRLGRDAGRISDEVLTHLTGLVGVKAKIVLEIEVEAPDGIPEDKIRIINENCNTLKFKQHGFEEE